MESETNKETPRSHDEPDDVHMLLSHKDTTMVVVIIAFVVWFGIGLFGLAMLLNWAMSTADDQQKQQHSTVQTHEP